MSIDMIKTKWISIIVMLFMGLTSTVIGAEGDILWQTGNLGESLEAGPAVDSKSNVYMLTETGLRSYTTTGTLRWLTPVSTGISHNAAVSVSLSSDETVVFGCGTESVWAVKASTGVPIWVNRTLKHFFTVPCVSKDNSRIYVGNGDVHNTVGTLYCLDASNGNVHWSRDLNGGLMGGAVLTDSGTIIIPSEGQNEEKGTLYSITDNGSSSTINWTYDLLGESRLPPTIDSAGHIYIATGKGIVHKVDPTAGTSIWKAECPGGCKEIFAAMALSGDESTIYVNAENYKLNAFNTSDGSLKWDIEFEHWGSDPLVRDDGVIIVASQIKGTARVAAIQDNGSSASILWTSPSISHTLHLNETNVNIAPNGTIYIHAGDWVPLALTAIEGNGKGLNTSSNWPKVMGNIQNNGNSNNSTPP